MILLDYNALRDTPVASEPFPHVVVPHFVPPDALRAVVADLPPLGKRGSFPVTGVALGPVARSLMAATGRRRAAHRDRAKVRRWTWRMRPPC